MAKRKTKKVKHKPFVMLVRSEKAVELFRQPDAFVLLSVIAYRARRTGSFNVHDLAPGEALLGDYKSYGMTERRYRTAKKKLEKWQLATFRATNKGTIAKLVDASIYDINAELGDEQNDSQETDKRRAGDD